MPQDKYDHAYQHLLPDGKQRAQLLQLGQQEVDCFPNDVKAASQISTKLLRNVTSSDFRLWSVLLKGGTLQAKQQKRDVSEITTLFNNQNVVLNNKDGTLTPLDSDHLSAHFTGPKNEWPHVVMVSNSNLPGLQSFHDELTTAAKLLTPLRGSHTGEPLVIGSYGSEKNIAENALKSMRRMHEIRKGNTTRHRVSDATFAQVDALRHLLVAQDENGHPVRHEGIPVLRADAADILDRTTFIGYSGGFLSNNDTLRLFQEMLADGKFAQDLSYKNAGFRKTDASVARSLLSHATSIGIGGLDQMHSVPWKRINLMSPHDTSLTFGGNQLLRASDTIAVPTPSALGEAPDANHHKKLDTTHGGHGLASYYKAIVSLRNVDVINQVHAQLTGTQLLR